jgi:hypothetical protein
VGLAEAVFHLVATDGDPLLAIAVGTKILVMDARSPFHDKSTSSSGGR